MLGLVIFAGFIAICSVIILVATALLGASPRIAFDALMWTTIAWLGGAILGWLIGGASRQVFEWIVGGAVTFVVLQRKSGHVDVVSWLLLILLGPTGWFIALWRCNAGSRQVQTA